MIIRHLDPWGYIGFSGSIKVQGVRPRVSGFRV